MWQDFKDSHGAVLRAEDATGRHVISPYGSEWECLDTETGALIATHHQLSVIKRIASDRIRARGAEVG